MAAESILRTKSDDFALRIVNCFKYLQNDRNEHVMSKQLLRSGTSIGANVTEGIYAQSRNDFVSKLSISLKEAQETSYWLRLLFKADYLDENQFNSIHNDNEEIIKLLISTIKSTKGTE
ncbi:MAG: four helix bundle protein [Prevotella sp.]|nr:four helix bundle protein [Prevotella sp.]